MKFMRSRDKHLLAENVKKDLSLLGTSSREEKLLLERRYTNELRSSKGIAGMLSGIFCIMSLTKGNILLLLFLEI